MNIYISTGGFSHESADLTVKNFEKSGIKNIELSGGRYKKNLFSFLAASFPSCIRAAFSISL